MKEKIKVDHWPGARSDRAGRAGMSALRAGALVAACALALGIASAAEHAPDGADAADDMPPDLPGAADYLSQDLRAEVEALKAEVRRTPSNRANAGARARTLWAWVNAYARSGRYVPVNATLAAAGVLAYPNQPRLATLDPTIRELALLDEQPDAVGALVADVGPFEARSYATIRQTYSVGAKDVEPSGGFLIARHFMTDFAFQADDATGDNYLAIGSSNPTVRFAKSALPVAGMHGGFQGAADRLVFRVISGRLTAGDTVTVTYGDTTGGGRGLLMPSFSSDRMPLPLYVDFDGSGTFVSLPIQPIVVVGGRVAGVHGFAPSVVAAGEPFDLSVRAEDGFYNRAEGAIPAWEVTVNGEQFAHIDVGREPITVLRDIRFDEPGVYRFTFRSEDGAITGVANPVLVEEAPKRRIYWGDTHGHSGFAEGIGTPEKFMVWARDDARLDYVTHSEHDIWMDDYEWSVLQDNVRRFSEDGEFVAFLGYEWTVRNIQGGHHNVLFRTPEGRRRIPAQEFGTLSALYQGLRAHHDPNDVVVIPHAHQAGNARLNDPLLEPLVEIMSEHGNFEWFGRLYLNHGHQIGFIAASDNHLSQPGYSAPLGGSLSQRGGLGALRSQTGGRDALFDAMKNRATYATTGDRMILDVALNGTEMGGRAPFDAHRNIEGRVVGTAPIASIAVVKNDAEIWRRDYLIDDAESGDGDYLLTFQSASDPFHPFDNPRGWRWWRGEAAVQDAQVAAAEGSNFHHAENQMVDVTDGSGLAFSTFTRGSASSIRLHLADVRRSARLTIQLTEGREFGGGPPRFRSHQVVPASEVVLELRDMKNGIVRAELPFDGYTDVVTLRRIVAGGEMDVSFTVQDRGDREGDYYYVRVEQANDAVAWSSPIWVGGFPSR